MKLTTRFAVANALLITMAITIAAIFAFASMRKEIERKAAASQESILATFWELLQSRGDGFRVVDGKLLVGDRVLNGDNEIPDKIREIFGGTATIFMGDTRVATNVLQADGTRALGTKLTGAAYDAVFREGRPYRGEARILDIPYFTAYDPIRNAEGEVIGALYVGVKRSDYFAAYNSLKTWLVFATAVMAALFSCLAVVLTKKLFFPVFRTFSDTSGHIHSQARSIADAIDRQAELATRLSSSVVEISSTMEEFSSTASQIAQHCQKVVERADKTLDDTKTGAAEVENLTFKVNEISQTIEENLKEIVELGRRSKEINRIMEIINNIANQTKLIAFNAALEAASAGEAGRRFGVVAVEIRRLADSVVESTSEIEGKITEIQDAVNRLVMSSEKSAQLIQEGQEYASHTVVMLIESVDGVEETAGAARQISLSTQQQQIASSQVLLAIKDIQEGARVSTDAVRQSNRAMGELSTLTGRLKALVSELTEGRRGQKEAEELLQLPQEDA